MLSSNKTSNTKYLITSALVLGLASCSSNPDHHFDDPIEVIEYHDDYSDDSQVLDYDSLSGVHDEPLGHSEVSYPDAAEGALVGEYGDNEFVDPYGDGLASQLDELTIQEDSYEIGTDHYVDLGDSDPSATDSAIEYVDTDYYSQVSDSHVPTDHYSQVSDSHVPAMPTTSDSYAAPVSTDGMGQYIVQPGDTLGTIALKIMGSSRHWSELAEQNGISSPNRILPGDVINYPLTPRSEEFAGVYQSLQSDTITVKSGDTLSSIAAKTLGRSSYWRTIWRLNADIIPNPNVISPGQVLRYIDPGKLQSQVTAKGWSNYGH